MARLDLKGKRFGKLRVKDFAYVKNGRTFWSCVCDCDPDKEVVIKGKYLTNGDTKSCGCLSKENSARIGKNNKKFNDYYEKDGVIHVKFFNSKEEFLCDSTDWERSKQICWHKTKANYVRGEYDEGLVLFHDYILADSIPQDYEIDHISGNRLDNRRCNLRICTRKENALNKGLYSNNKSGVSGVFWHKGCKKWTVQIQKDKNNLYLGSYDTFEEAVSVRRRAEETAFGDYRRKIAENYAEVIS